MEWISIKDRLPDELQNVLLCVKGCEEKVVVKGSFCWDFHDCNCVDCEKKFMRYQMDVYPGEEFLKDYKVTHWMPLPAAPVEE